MVPTKKKKQNKLTGRQKAAAFLVALGADTAVEIFKHLREEEVEGLVFEMAAMEKVTPDVKDQVLEEFNEMMMAQNFMETVGIEYAKEMLEKLYGPTKAAEILDRMMGNLKKPPFDSLRRTDPDIILNFIQHEHPQTIALVLCYLEPKKAAHILSRLPHQIQANVARRIAVMERVSPEIPLEVERILARKLVHTRDDFTNAGGIPSAVEVLNQVDRGTERLIIEALEEEDPELAEEIKKKMFTFDHLGLVDDAGMQLLLREVSTDELVKALKDADPEIYDKVIRNMTKRAAAMLIDEIEFHGPAKRRDVETAQQSIVAIVRRMEENGDVIIARNDEELVV